MRLELYTIGHSSHTMDEFIWLLVDHEITQLAYVRCTPYSCYCPQFNKTVLRESQLARGIDYTWMGEALGGHPKDPPCYKHRAIPDKPGGYLNEVSFPDVILRPWFTEGIHNLLELADPETTCMMCAEKDPARWHSHQLIAMYLMDWHPEVTVWHILVDSRLADARSILGMDETSDA